jgi:hypothetical protein
MEFSMEFHEIVYKHLTDFFNFIFPWNFMEFSMEFHSMEFSMEFYEAEVDGIPWNFMKLRLMEFHGIPWKIQWN